MLLYSLSVLFHDAFRSGSRGKNRPRWIGYTQGGRGRRFWRRCYSSPTIGSLPRIWGPTNIPVAMCSTLEETEGQKIGSGWTRPK